MIVSWVASHWYLLLGPAFIALCVLQPALVWRFKWQLALAAVAALAVMQWMAVNEQRGRNTQLQGELDAYALREARAAVEAIESAQAREHRLNEQMHLIDLVHEEEMRNALAKKDATIACLRNGTCRVRDRFTCPKPTTGKATDPGVSDGAEASGLRIEDAEFLVSESERADANTRQLTQCQATVSRLVDFIEGVAAATSP